MCQRAMIALALACQPDLLIADEPTTALDVTTEAQILVLMRELQATMHSAIMYITHNLAVVAEIAQDVMVMYMGKDVELAPIDAIFHEPKHPYTMALLNSIPRIDADKEMLEVLPGAIPDPYNLPTGCPFHPRCARAACRCAASRSKCLTCPWRRTIASAATCMPEKPHAHDRTETRCQEDR